MGRRYRTLRGFRDILPGETEHWQAFEQRCRELFARYGFREIRPPLVEPTELFVRSVGEQTDIVGKEMFTFGEGDESMTLRPEVTASVCRAYIEHGLDRRGAGRLWYLGPCFRRERPQKGRYRQFHQVGMEVFGEREPATDLEALALALDVVRAAGIDDARLVVNSIGDEACRPAYRARLVAFLEQVADRLGEDSRRRLHTNPLRVLDSKDEQEQALFAEAPRITDALCDACRAHHDAVRDGLARLGIPYEEDPRLVRGLDYYVRTTFEVRATRGLGAQNAVLGGGRYDGLVRALGGPDVPGLGWAAGIERLLLAGGVLDEPAAARLDVYVVTLGASPPETLALVQALRAEGLAAGWDPGGHGLGGQMKRAGRSGARFAVLLGDDERARGTSTIKDLASGEQFEGPGDPGAIAALVRSRISGEGAAT
ncbi:MAG: histidine--tRNA ligase [Acidobacteriota bacterium]|nr:MAG: histidine--tRNA ligase [Acidobacteriota bacterium]